jgi:UDP-N-acetylglucosamine/UDP-N-acetylgalactosamine diphosphorylase
VIGGEAPSTIENCQLGKEVQLHGGYFSEATFLDRVQMGSGAHVRSGTLLEEEASAAHTVGFKQTIFFPFVTAGSLINFCDCLMAGGTGKKNHSEIGSSYIHFNFTPRQDKATASLIGDVPKGVMLDRAAIFLGGQGGLVGPSRIAYGTVIPAGSICRKDVLIENQMYMPPAIQGGEPQKSIPGQYFGIRRIMENNLIYIGNLHALKAWYRLVRKRFMTGDVYSQACWQGAMNRLDDALEERIRRLGELAEKMPRSLEIGTLENNLFQEGCSQQKRLIKKWPSMQVTLKQDMAEKIDAALYKNFINEWERIEANSYIEAVSKLSPDAKTAGSAWLQKIVDFAAAQWEN